MNNKLRNIIEKIRNEFSKDPSLIMIGEMNDGLKSETRKALCIKPYCDFLEVCNGARCGIIDLWSDEDIENNQYRVTDLIGGSDNWICIGQILYEPLVFNLKDEQVYLFFQGHEREIKESCFGEFDTFLLNYVFGKRYRELMPNTVNDEWYDFLKRLALF